MKVVVGVVLVIMAEVEVLSRHLRRVFIPLLAECVASPTTRHARTTLVELRRRVDQIRQLGQNAGRCRECGARGGRWARGRSDGETEGVPLLDGVAVEATVVAGALGEEGLPLP